MSPEDMRAEEELMGRFGYAYARYYPLLSKLVSSMRAIFEFLLPIIFGLYAVTVVATATVKPTPNKAVEKDAPKAVRLSP
ncbi:MAG: hypothetical protein JJE30_12325 [Desulfuromonadales bacterium]|nr:hypothetical protein [Desulfuromonadales bacterium]